MACIIQTIYLNLILHTLLGYFYLPDVVYITNYMYTYITYITLQASDRKHVVNLRWSQLQQQQQSAHQAGLLIQGSAAATAIQNRRAGAGAGAGVGADAGVGVGVGVSSSSAATSSSLTSYLTNIAQAPRSPHAISAGTEAAAAGVTGAGAGAGAGAGDGAAAAAGGGADSAR